MVAWVAWMAQVLRFFVFICSCGLFVLPLVQTGFSWFESLKSAVLHRLASDL